MFDIAWREEPNGSFRASVRWPNGEGDAALHFTDEISMWCHHNLGKERRWWRRVDSYTIGIHGRRQAMLFKLTWIGA